MESYIVIQLKNIKERVSILTFLAAETTSKFSVTDDLKDFVSRQFNVKIVENNAYLLPLHENVMDNHVEQVTVNCGQLQPKEEVMDDISIDNDSSIPIFDELLPTSTNDEDDDVEEEEDLEMYIPSSSRPKKRKLRDGSSSSDKVECKSCLKLLDAQYRNHSEALGHAITHTDLKRYECPAKGCGYKAGPARNVTSHIRRVHNNRSLQARKLEITPEEEEELERVVKECFPGIERGKKLKKCQVCREKGLERRIEDTHPHMRAHSLTHVDFMLYKCNQQGCLFESKTFKPMAFHLKSRHLIESTVEKDTRVQLAPEQQKLADNIIHKCFPAAEPYDESVE